MANEIRVYDNLVGGLVENNPLTAADTTLDSVGLIAMRAIDSTNHAVIVFDPDGLTGAPYAKRVTAHTLSDDQATIEAAALWGTARDIPRDTPWVHAMTADDIPIIYYSQPTDGVTRASTTLGALSTAWQSVFQLGHAAMVVDYELAFSGQCAADEVMEVALTRGGTIIDRMKVYTSGGGNRENRNTLTGRDIPASVGPHTYEVFVASSSGSTVTVNTSVDTSTAFSTTADGVSSMKLTARWRTA